MRQTQIVATIGPACDNPDCVAEMIKAGMNIARFNTKHNIPEWHQERIYMVHDVAQKIGQPVKILLDLQGPEVRIKVPHGDSFFVDSGEEVEFTADPNSPFNKSIVIPQHVIDSLQVNNKVLLNDGMCEFVIAKKETGRLLAKALESFEVNTDKTMNTPEVVLDMPSLLEKDLHFLDSLAKDHLDYVGLSFVRDAKDINILRDELQKRQMSTQIIAKIENQAALDHLSEIVDAADAVMVARGDMGVEIPYYQVPYWQKEIIAECREKGKFVITATQMLLTMVSHPRPSRAEVSDVANAVYDGTDAVMLSEESATGRYPIKAVKTQAEIVEYYEQFVVK